MLTKSELAFFILNILPWFFLGVWILYSLLVVFNKELRENYSNYYVVQSIPGVFVTLGLLGTFMGITYGLLFFDTSPDLIRNSIQNLLNGLRTAMLTSITGIILSILFGKFIKIRLTQNVIAPPKSPELKELIKLNENFVNFQKEISTTQYEIMVEAMKDVLKDFNTIFKDFIGELVNENFKELKTAIENLVYWQKENKVNNEILIKSYKTLVSKHSEFTKKTDQWVANLDEIAGQTSKLRRIIDKFNEAFKDDGNMAKILKEILEASNSLKATLANLEGISKSISDTNNNMKVTTAKITEWTEAVVTVSESSKEIVEKMEAMQTINISHVDSLVEQFNSNLKGTFKTFDGLILEYIKDVEQRINKLNKK